MGVGCGQGAHLPISPNLLDYFFPGPLVQRAGSGLLLLASPQLCNPGCLRHRETWGSHCAGLLLPTPAPPFSFSVSGPEPLSYVSRRPGKKGVCTCSCLNFLGLRFFKAFDTDCQNSLHEMVISAYIPNSTVWACPWPPLGIIGLFNLCPAGGQKNPMPHCIFIFVSLVGTRRG